MLGAATSHSVVCNPYLLLGYLVFNYNKRLCISLERFLNRYNQGWELGFMARYQRGHGVLQGSVLGPLLFILHM